jgi:hypothetical protein
MSENRLPKSIRKYLRLAKARIRGESLDSVEAGRKITALVAETHGRFANRKA